MPKLAANLSMLFTERPFIERFAAAAQAGFQGVEYLFPYDHDSATIAQALRANGLTQVLFNLPPGDWDAGERGLACLPGRESEFRGSVKKALDYAQTLGCQQLHMMAGLRPVQVSDTVLKATYLANLRYAAEQAKPLGVTILVEPINPIDMPGYYLQTATAAKALLAECRDLDNVGIQLDLYHRQMLEGRIADALAEFLPMSPHIQIAGVPGRHEPGDQGEVNWSWVLAALDKAGYAGWVGCEYRPSGATQQGLAWATAYLPTTTATEERWA